MNAGRDSNFWQIGDVTPKKKTPTQDYNWRHFFSYQGSFPNCATPTNIPYLLLLPMVTIQSGRINTHYFPGSNPTMYDHWNSSTIHNCLRNTIELPHGDTKDADEMGVTTCWGMCLSPKEHKCVYCCKHVYIHK